MPAVDKASQRDLAPAVCSSRSRAAVRQPAPCRAGWASRRKVGPGRSRGIIGVYAWIARADRPGTEDGACLGPSAHRSTRHSRINTSNPCPSRFPAELAGRFGQLQHQQDLGLVAAAGAGAQEVGQEGQPGATGVVLLVAQATEHDQLAVQGGDMGAELALDQGRRVIDAGLGFDEVGHLLRHLEVDRAVAHLGRDVEDDTG